MDCTEAENLLSAYHDGELAAASASAVEAHLSDCPRCSLVLADLRRADEAVRRSADRLAGGLDVDRLAAAVACRADQIRPGRLRRVLAVLLPLSAAAAAALLLAPLVRQAERPPVEPVAWQLDACVLLSVSRAGPREAGDVEHAGASVVAGVVPAGPTMVIRLGEPGEVAVASPLAAAEPVAIQPGPPTVILAGGMPRPVEFDPLGPLPKAEYARLLRQVEVVLTRAATLGESDHRGWSELGGMIRRDGLIERVRRGRQPLPPDDRMNQVLASAEAMLIRAELAAEWGSPAEVAAVQQGIMVSGILDRCRALRT